MNGLGSDRQAGIDLAFENSPNGTNPNIKHPSLSENGHYFNGAAPEPDPDQGFPDAEAEYDFYEEDCDYDYEY